LTLEPQATREAASTREETTKKKVRIMKYLKNKNSERMKI
jgi:hypothetical protein